MNLSFNIGDKVAVIDDVIKGKVIAVYPHKVVVETSDEFSFEFSPSELVLIKAEQSELSKYSDITNENLLEWTNNLNGIVPFLWDNTMYSHHPFSSSPMFTGWNNNFPIGFDKTTAGNGIFANGDLSSEDTKVSVITFNDYMWNPISYDPEQSINIALNNFYGEELSKKIMAFKNCELNLRKTIGERELWYDSDILWQAIRKAKKTTTKNPFYYHFNYTRMKALRLQLKNSVPEPIEKNLFKNKCVKLVEQRDFIIKTVEEINPVLSSELRKISIPLPDFENIK